MDCVDSRLLRAHFRGGVFVLAGIDPRRTVVDLARRTGISRLTVRRRLERWVSEGFWGPIAVFPNPGTIGCSFYFQGFGVEGAKALAEFEADVDRSEQIAFVFQVADFFGVLYVARSPRELSRFARKVERSPNVHAMSVPARVAFPAPQAALRPKDRRILASFRRRPTPEWERVAAEVGMTARGLRRRVAQLIEADLLFFFPELDFRRSDGAVAQVNLLLGGEADPAEIRARMSRRFPDMIEMENIFPVQSMLPPTLRGEYEDGGCRDSTTKVADAFCCFLPVRSSATCDDLHRELSGLVGVRETLILAPVRNYQVARCMDRWTSRLLEEVPTGDRGRPLPAPDAGGSLEGPAQVPPRRT